MWFKVGVLASDSAWRAVYRYLFYTDPSILKAYYALWGKNAEWYESEPDTGNPVTSVYSRSRGSLQVLKRPEIL